METKINGLDRRGADLRDAHPAVASRSGRGWTEYARMAARNTFGEILLRWVPPAAFGAAFERLLEDDVDA
jgi:hypothetical protein